MKKILIILLFPFCANAQLAGIKIVNFGLQARDLESIVGNIFRATSDESFEMFQCFRISYRNSPPASPSTIVTADTVTAKALLELFRMASNEPSFFTDVTNNRIRIAIKAVVNAPLQSAVSAYEAEALTEVQRRRDWGRKKLSGIIQ